MCMSNAYLVRTIASAYSHCASTLNKEPYRSDASCWTCLQTMKQVYDSVCLWNPFKQAWDLDFNMTKEATTRTLMSQAWNWWLQVDPNIRRNLHKIDNKMRLMMVL